MDPDETLENRDIDHYDALTLIRDRFFGLRCAIRGADIANPADSNGLQQLAEDIAESLKAICGAFASERAIRSYRQP